jgi:hypothetical protein
VRDSGLVHALLGIEDQKALLGHPVAGIDLLLQRPGERKPWAIEIKRGLSPKLERGFYHACESVAPLQRRVVYSGDESFPLAEDVQAVPLKALCDELAALD